MKPITITITGERRAGKSSLAALLQVLLPAFGYRVQFKPAYHAEMKVNNDIRRTIEGSLFPFVPAREVDIETKDL